MKLLISVRGSQLPPRTEVRTSSTMRNINTGVKHGRVRPTRQHPAWTFSRWDESVGVTSSGPFSAIHLRPGMSEGIMARASTSGEGSVMHA